MTTLSDKLMDEGYMDKVLFAKDVKEFIKKIKDRLDYSEHYIIDEEAGPKLT